MTARDIYVRNPSVLDASATSFLPLGGNGTLAVGSSGHAYGHFTIVSAQNGAMQSSCVSIEYLFLGTTRAMRPLQLFLA